jgi:NADPH2:quinone reductase
VIGYFWGSYRRHKPDLVRQSFEELLRWFDQGRLKPHVSETMDLAEIGRAYALLRQRRSTGKVVLTTGR